MIRLKLRAWWNRVTGKTHYLQLLIEAETLHPMNTQGRGLGHANLLLEAAYAIYADYGPHDDHERAIIDAYEHHKQFDPEPLT